jgi:tRNA1Val (adenine37-N6)-methyltransferase
MPNPYFKFKQFTVYHDRCAMKVTTDGCLFGAWCAAEVRKSIINSQGAMGDDVTTTRRLLDIGTGTGLLSLMIAQQNCVHIDAIEIDGQAAEQAKENVKESPFSSNIAVYHSDIMDWGKGPYDVIVSNPPFYEKEVPSSQQHKNVAHHGEGLRLESLFQIISEKLTPTGSFYLLLPYKRRNDIEKLLRNTHLYLEKQVIVHPVVSNQPFRLLLKGSKHPVITPQVESLSIYNDSKAYTPEFVTLLSDYYLNL